MPLDSAILKILLRAPSKIGLHILLMARFYAAWMVSGSHPSAKAMMALFSDAAIFFSAYFNYAKPGLI